ncbi:MAG TPA: GIY-YIG nuclease family protein [Terriglobales bacterium]|nr:GIY-YIG nuclease family protein [Terriglobales bacterium]
MVDRKELVRQYKEAGTSMGVYRIRNLRNGRSFVGSARDVRGKLNGHLAQLKMGVHRNRELQRDWNELGPEAFAFEVVDLLEAKHEPDYDPTEDLRVLEELWLEKLQPFGDQGYNTPGRRI